MTRTQPHTDFPRYLTTSEVAEITRVPPETVRAWLRSGRLASRRAGRRLLVRADDLRTFLGEDPR